MTDSTEERAEQASRRKSIALAASLFGDTDSNSLDFFASPPEAPEPLEPSNKGFHHAEESDAAPYDHEYTENGTVDHSYASEGYYDNYGQWQPHSQQPPSYAQYDHEFTEHTSGDQSYSSDGNYDNYGQWHTESAQPTSSYAPPTESSPYTPSPYDPSTYAPSAYAPPLPTSYLPATSNDSQSHLDDFVPEPPAPISHDDVPYTSYDPPSIPRKESLSHADPYAPHTSLPPHFSPFATYDPLTAVTTKASQSRPESSTQAAPALRDAAPYSAYDPPLIPSKKLTSSHVDRYVSQTNSFSRDATPHSAYEPTLVPSKPPIHLGRPIPQTTSISPGTSSPAAYDPPVIPSRRDSRGHTDHYTFQSNSTDVSPYIPHNPPSVAFKASHGNLDSFQQAAPISYDAPSHSPYDSPPVVAKVSQSRKDNYVPQTYTSVNARDPAPYAPHGSPTATSWEPQRNLDSHPPQAAHILHDTSPYNPLLSAPRESLGHLDSYNPQAAPIFNDTSEFAQYNPSHNPPSMISQSSFYAPSPSVNAADDLRRTARIPIFCFGFGGKVASCFHSQLDATAGFDVSFSGRWSSPVEIRMLNKLIPASALEPSTFEFPGPLFSGSSGPAMALVRTTASNTSKSKKASVVKYLTERAEEVRRGLGFLSSAKDSAADRWSIEARAVLLKLLSVIIENDGKISGRFVSSRGFI